MRGRLYDPQIGRFLTTDPIVADPGSGQSWNPYSYVLNNPLAYTDPSGFAGETPDGSTLVDLPGGYGLSYKAPPPIGPPPPAAPKVVASQVGLGKAPGVVGPTGEEARPEAEPTVEGPTPGMAARVRQDRMPGPAGFDPSAGKGGVEIGAEVTRGALAGVGGAVGDALSIDLLHVPTGLIRIVGDAWASGDPIGGLSAIFWEPGRAQVDQVVASAVEGDFEGAAEAGVKAITVGVATGVVIGEIGGAGVEAAKDVKEVSVSRGKSPEALKHLEETGQTGRALTVDRAGAAARRRGNMEGVETRPGLDRDESPPAVFREGQGGSVRHIPSGDNRSAGGQIGRQIKGLPNGAKVIIKGTD